MLHSIIPYALAFTSLIPTKEELEAKHKERMNELLVRWEATKALPRKKKKRIRKQINKEYSLECSIYNWSNKTFSFNMSNYFNKFTL